MPRPALGGASRRPGGKPFYALENRARTFPCRWNPAGGRGPVPAALRNRRRPHLGVLPAETREAAFSSRRLSPAHHRAGARGGIPPAAEEADVIRLEPGGRIRFTHPLLASTVYERASDEHRREVHRLLAERVGDPEERPATSPWPRVSPMRRSRPPSTRRPMRPGRAGALRGGGSAGAGASADPRGGVRRGAPAPAALRREPSSDRRRRARPRRAGGALRPGPDRRHARRGAARVGEAPLVPGHVNAGWPCSRRRSRAPTSRSFAPHPRSPVLAARERRSGGLRSAHPCGARADRRGR